MMAIAKQATNGVPARGEDSSSQSTSRQKIIKIVLGVSFLAAIAIVFVLFRDELSLEKLAHRQSQFEDYKAEHPVLIYGIAFVVYVVVTGLSLPGATAMTLVYGWLFRFFPALILVSFASTLGATIAFLVSRYLLRETIQSRFGARLAGFNRALEREGAFYLFTLRLIVGVPFFLINLVMGLTPIPARTFWWVSQVGMLPGTAVFVYAGYSVPTLDKLAETGVGGVLNAKLVVAFVMLGVFPLVAKKVLGAIRPAAEEDELETS